MAMLDAILRGDGSIESSDERAIFYCLSLDACPFPRN